MEKSEKIKNKLKILPAKPGVYLMKNDKGKIIYVGKARSLKNRVKSYFLKTEHDLKTTLLVSKIADFEYILTPSDSEAFLLEANLIKKYRPKYNILLKDDKKYPFIKVTLNEDFPRTLVTRDLKKDGSKYFGPYHEASIVRRTLRLVDWVFPLRTCNLTIHADKENQYSRPCINYQLKKCFAPCVGYISKDEYYKIVKNVMDFLNSKDDEVIENLKTEMLEYSEKMEFEKAADLRDKIRSIEKVQRSQSMYFTDFKNRDVIGYYQIDQYAAVTVLKIISGKLLNREVYRMENSEDSDPQELVTSFIKQYYSNKLENLPHKIICQIEPQDFEELNVWLSGRLHIPQRGEQAKLISIAKENAFNLVENEKLKHIRKKERTILPVQELKEKLGLKSLPRKIVCFDISTIQGTDTVASMVFFENGKPKKKNYRHFIVKTVEGQNDFASMNEVVGRYLNNITDEEKPEEKPDLIVIDGGKGQLNIIYTLMQSLGIDDIELISLAKRIEEVFFPMQSESIYLPRSSSALKMIVHLRDEAHRFAITFHRKRRSNRTLISELDGIKGVSDEKKFLLLKTFKSVDKIRESSIDDLTKIKGIGEKLAQRIYKNLNKLENK